MTYSTAYSKEFELVDIKNKPANDGKLKCDDCQNCMVRAIDYKGVEEMKYFCPIDHTITWSTTEPVLVKVCSRQLPYAEVTLPTQVQSGVAELEALEMDLSEFEDFEPDTKPFSNNV